MTPSRTNVTDSWTETGDQEKVPQANPMQEMGVTGLKRTGGYLDEEFLPALRGRKAVKVFREMSLNDSMVGSLLFAVDKLLHEVEWVVKPVDQTKENAEAARFLEECRDDMCYDDQTEVLTRRGWVLFRDLTDTDEVAQRAQDGTIEYVVPRQRHEYDYEGDLLCVRGKSLDLAVSPNHRLLMAMRTGRKHDVAQKNDLEIIKAKEAYGRKGWMSKACRWDGTPSGYTTDYLELLGFAAADGCFSDGRYVVLIQKDTEYVEALLKRNGISARTRQVNGSTQWVVGASRMARELISDFGRTSTTRRIPEWLQEAPPVEIEAFLLGYDHGDGYTSPSGLTGLYTSSKAMADDLQVLAMKCGRAATVLTRAGSPSSFSPGSAQYRVSIWSERKEHTAPYVRYENWEKRPYDGKIYCVSVPTGVIMVRRNGIAVWSGNSHSWDDFISEVLTCLAFGWSWHEVVYKRRVGPWEKDPAKRSKHTDGKIGWRKIPIRSQETMMRWVFDDHGGIKGMVQMAPPKYSETVIPIEKSLLFRTTVVKNNPEGQSMLRTAYRSWFFKKRLEEFEAVGVERDLAGMPVGKVPSEYLTAKPGTPQAKTVDAFRKMVRGVRRDENEGLILPVAYDPDTKQPLFDFELMSSSGSRQFDTNSIIQRYEQRILMSVLADFILVGHQATGSYALHTDKTGIFRAALNSIVKSIAETLNRYAVPRLFEINGMKLDELPKFEPTNVDPPDLNQLASFISATSGAGMQWFPDPELEKFMREIARLPEMSEEAVDFKREMLAQTQAMDFAQNQMGLLGMKQKAALTAQGFSPEQAEMQAQQPTPEMQAQERLSQDEAEMAHREHPIGREEQEQMQFAQEQEAAQQQASGEQEDGKFQRDAERMSLQDALEERKHRRLMEQMKAKERGSKKPPERGRR